MNSAFFEGFILQSSLILALGAQNIFVLESGMKRNHSILVASLCSFFDFLLIMLGVMGAASLFLKFEILSLITGIAGVLFLIYTGLQKTREFFISNREAIQTSSVNSLYPRSQIIRLTLAFTLLNPHVYLDTFVLIGGYSTRYSSLEDRFFFGLGASTVSLLWFFSLISFATFLSQYLKRPTQLRWISLFSGLLLFGFAIKLGLELVRT